MSSLHEVEWISFQYSSALIVLTKCHPEKIWFWHQVSTLIRIWYSVPPKTFLFWIRRVVLAASCPTRQIDAGRLEARQESTSSARRVVVSPFDCVWLCEQYAKRPRGKNVWIALTLIFTNIFIKEKWKNLRLVITAMMEFPNARSVYPVLWQSIRCSCTIWCAQIERGRRKNALPLPLLSMKVGFRCHLYKRSIIRMFPLRYGTIFPPIVQSVVDRDLIVGSDSFV